MAAKIAQISTVHSPHDPRIFHKECKSLAKAGFQVYLIITAKENSVIDDVNIVSLPPTTSRWSRMTIGVYRAYKAARAVNPEIYHFHDPELIPIGLLLKLLGKRVVYDIHEDYVTDIQQKGYIPQILRNPLAKLFGYFESAVVGFFEQVVAEKYYSERFPKATTVLNYPFFKPIETKNKGELFNSHPLKLLYTGNVTEDRGAWQHSALVNFSEDFSVTLVGKCRDELAQQLKAKTATSPRLEIIGVGEHVPFERILDQYRQGGWLAGLALFPETPHYTRKELTKFFEYMAAGLPIICSNFKAWRELIVDNGVGIAVDPNNQEEIKKAIYYLRDNPEIRAEMSRKGKELVVSTYNWEHEASKLVALCKRMIEKV
jgi:glycosyltransferase involved in cell wall biosynthesis